jgi:hypothetical protein
MARLDLDLLLRTRPLVVSLYDLSGNWARPWSATHDVILVDHQHPGGISEVPGVDDWRTPMTAVGMDSREFVRAWPMRWQGRKVDCVLAAPPCTVFCLPGARLWRTWDQDGTTECQLDLVTAVLRFVRKVQPRVWALENPPGRLWNQKGRGLLQDEMGPPTYRFQPYFHGDPWTKKTYLWGSFRPPEQHPVEPQAYPEHLPPGRRDRTSRMSSSWRRARAQTPKGFSRDFYEANKP